MSETNKLTMIMAKGSNHPCVHGSTYCRRCFGEQIGHYEKKAQMVAPTKTKNKKK
jgi:hypothetical protein